MCQLFEKFAQRFKRRKYLRKTPETKRTSAALTEPPPPPIILLALKEIEVNRVCHGDDNFKFFLAKFGLLKF
ncbi:MAG: hypothetical protein A2651_04180 [Candidatus Yanofskybacteria bacterium RIFCSPHIGHO2_01_FULL_42_12]|uniref:Uncharacterized protein n=1 Tax=Candidatus Yanofskybacteria bacterium RIFCSPLOWO2_01_FULL_42_49 TaxID=1802694 RepID=A0A1F8GCV6_9BACT|nr:MAG: hypothetical protein A2651_04180 [Candidatus Yanofskybacteria bacterium RIFCSPHIGHO2_01_FULL_42_12]OGN22588.1 MAG: hypothetical protein A2918_02400 [Candidatus Yanofskybacteria bacterium RIFCSPLOWO2_01_FULL_42_49]